MNKLVRTTVEPVVKSTKIVQALAYWRANPVEAVKDWFNVTPEDYQGDMLMDLLATNGVSRVIAKSGHGVGKTSTEGWAMMIYLMTRAKSRCVATAPTQSQLKDILWPETAKWIDRMPEEFKGMWDVNETHIRHKKFSKTWFATARTSNKQENLQGFHGDNILVLVDEGSGVPQNVFEVIEGILTGADEHGLEAKLFMAGNPTQIQGEFYNAFHKNKNLYSRYTISGDLRPPSDPNGGRIYVSRRVSQAYRDTMSRKYGTDSAVYDVRVRGLFPSMADDTVLPLAWLERAQYVSLPVFDRVAHPVTLSMDVSRMGADETVLGYFRGGHCIWMKAWAKTSTNQCVDILWDARKSVIDEGLTLSHIVVDEAGVGGGVIDYARRLGLSITSYHGGASPSEASGDPAEDVRMFLNRRARDYWHLRRILERGQTHIPTDETLINQAASIKYVYNNNDKIKIESKGDMRDRLGDDASPDRADCLMMGLAPFYTFNDGLPPGLGTELDENIMFGNHTETSLQDFRIFT